MAALLSSSAVFGTKMAGPTRAHHTSRAQPVRVACAMDDRQKKAAAAVVAVVAPMIMNAQVGACPATRGASCAPSKLSYRVRWHRLSLKL